MVLPLNDIMTRIPANKFYPPALDSTHYLPRKRLLQKLLHSNARNRRIILIEAQAGQGKTILAAQYLKRHSASFAWYQIGPEDGDPVLFLTSLFSCLMRALPGFQSPLLTQMINKGEVSPLEYPRFVNLLLGNLDKSLKKNFYIVFDDLHLLEGAEISISLLGYLVRTAPQRLRFVLASRRPIGLDISTLRFERQTALVDNKELALNESEIAELYNEILQVPVTEETVRKLHRDTEGWVMGLILAATMEKSGQISSGAELKKDHLLDYFHSETFTRIPKEMQRTLLKLSWLDKIPTVLAKLISEVPDIDLKLRELNRKNFFVRSLDNNGQFFRFHYLFQDFLQEHASNELLQDEIIHIHGQAATYYLEQGFSEKALHHFLKANDIDAVEKVLERDGLNLYASNRVVTLESILSKIPEKDRRQKPWMLLFTGLISMGKNPLVSLHYFKNARILFAQNQNDIGELLAITKMIDFHVYGDCLFNLGPPLLRRAVELFDQIHSKLQSLVQIQVALSISMGYCFFAGDIPQADRYSAIALRLAEEHDLDNFKLMAHFVRGMESCFIGKWNNCRGEIESAFALGESPHLTTMTRQYLMQLPVNFFAVSGDFDGLSTHVTWVRQVFEKNIIGRNAMEPVNILFSIDGLAGRGSLREAMEVVRQGLAFGFSADTPHMRSQFLHYRAYLSAIDGQRDDALAAADESLHLRAVAGGKIFVILNEMIIGGTYTQLGLADKARHHLKNALEGSIEMGEEYLRAGIYAHLATLNLHSDNLNAARDDIKSCLRLMKLNQYHHFFSWTPTLMRPVLEAAVKYGIEVEYARHLAIKRLGLAILSGGITIPLLEITTLGGLSISIDGRVALKSEDLTKNQREILAILISSPDCKVCQEKLQTVLWPDSPPEKARANFDNLLMRLRNTLGKTVKPHALKDYLSLQKGIIYLKNCRIDASEFFKEACLGLKHVRSKAFWQAGNDFYSAHEFWKGPFLPNGPSSEAVQHYRDMLERLFIESSCQWAKILSQTGKPDEANKVLASALQYDPGNDELVRCIYQLHIKNDRPAQALLVLREYKATLEKSDYSQEDIKEILDALPSPTY